MSGRKCRSERSDRIVKACLMQCDHIHIAFTQEHLRLFRHARQMQRVEISRLVKNRCLRRIQVFRFTLTHHSATEADDLSTHIHDREHRTVPEFVVSATFFIKRDQTGLLEQPILIALAL